MNERIKELAEQAGMTDDKFGMFFAKDKHDEDGVDLEKFAELIIRECSKVIRNGGYRRGAFGNEDLRPSEIATMIEEHFGIEE